MTVKSGVMGCAALLGALMAGQVIADCTKPPLAGEYGFSVCKDWPAYPGMTLTARSQYEPGSAEGDGPNGTYDFDLAVLTASETSSVATLHKTSFFESNAVALQELELDTGRYKLTADLRAFGVRVRFKNSSRVNPMDEIQLTLYVKEGEKLRPVLERLLVYEFGGEWDGRCAGERSEVSRSIEMAQTRSHGFADLIVKSQQSNIVGVGEGEACKESFSKDKPVLTTLRYDGKTYVLPDGFKGF